MDVVRLNYVRNRQSVGGNKHVCKNYACAHTCEPYLGAVVGNLGATTRPDWGIRIHNFKAHKEFYGAFGALKDLLSKRYCCLNTAFKEPRSK